MQDVSMPRKNSDSHITNSLYYKKFGIVNKSVIWKKKLSTKNI